MTTQTLQQEETNREVSFNIRGIPLSLRNKFKSVCADKGLSMQDVVIALMEKYALDRDIRLPIENRPAV